MSVALLLWFCLSLLSGSGDAVPKDEKSPLQNFKVVQNTVEEEVKIGWNLVGPTDSASLILLNYHVSFYEKKSARKPKPNILQSFFLEDRDNTSAVSLGYLNLCASFSISVQANFQGGVLSNTNIDLERPCPMDNEKFKPRNLKVVEVKDSSLSLSWDKPEGDIPSNKVKYEISYTLKKTNETNRIKSHDIRGSNNVSISGMFPCSKYYIELTAIYNDFNSTLSTELETPVAFPRSLDFTTEVVSHDTVKLFIVPSTEGCPATSFLVSASGESKWDETIEEIVQLTTTEVNLTLTGLYPGTEYSFQVGTQNENGKGKSVSKNATTLDFEPTILENVEAFRASSETVRVKWYPPEKSYGTIKNYWVEIFNTADYPTTSTVYRASSKANQLSIHGFTSKNYSNSMAASVWVENQAFNGTKSLKVALRSVPKITKDPYDYS